MKSKNVFESYYERIAIKTLNMPEPMRAVMGGPDKQGAIEFLISIGYTRDEILKL